MDKIYSLDDKKWEHIRGDMYDKHIAFTEWAKEYDKLVVEQRSRALHKE